MISVTFQQEYWTKKETLAQEVLLTVSYIEANRKIYSDSSDSQTGF